MTSKRLVPPTNEPTLPHSPLIDLIAATICRAAELDTWDNTLHPEVADLYRTEARAVLRVIRTLIGTKLSDLLR